MNNSVSIDPQSVFRVSTHRVETSPFQDRWLTPESVLDIYAGRYSSMFDGEDVVDAYWKLRRQAVLYDVPERPVEISGSDATKLLDRVLARKVDNLKLGRGRYAIACTHQGTLFIDGVLFRLAEDRYWYVQPDGALETWLLAHSADMDVTVSDPKSRVLQLQGPTSPSILKAASDGAIDERMGYFHSGFFKIAGQEVYVSRTGWTGEIGYEIYTQGDATDCGRLWDRLLETGGAHGMIVASLASMEIRRIEAGILDSGTDFDRTMTPFEAGLGGFIDLEKTDFIGRDALLRASRGKRLFGLKCPDAAPGFRGAVLDGAKKVGRVTAAAWSPFLQAGIGYVRVDAARDWAGRKLTVETTQGSVRECEIVDLPFYDPEKRIPRGLAPSIP